MAIDISKNNNHIVVFPTFVASAMGQYGHVINLVMQADTDNGTLATKGAYVKFEQYKAAAVAANAVEVTVREAAAEKGCWYVEVTKLPSDLVFLVYNTPESPYPERELRDEALFYNATGDVTQGMELHMGDCFSLSADAFTGTIAEGAVAKYTAGKYVI